MVGDYLAASALAVFIYMSLVFLLSLRLEDYSIADIAWGGGFILVALLTLLLQGSYLPRHVLVTVLVVIWGARLVFHIYTHRRHRGEDPRYARWRKEWGAQHRIQAFFRVFVLQGLFLLLTAYPVILINSSRSGDLNGLDLAGFLVWMSGFAIETLADFQLARFRNTPGTGEGVLDTGLWKYSRHPNYFGEALLWWGIFLLCLSVPGGWRGAIGALTITLLVRYVSGVPLLEEHMKEREKYRDYILTTPVFIPWFPRRREQR